MSRGRLFGLPHGRPSSTTARPNYPRRRFRDAFITKHAGRQRLLGVLPGPMRRAEASRRASNACFAVDTWHDASKKQTTVRHDTLQSLQRQLRCARDFARACPMHSTVCGILCRCMRRLHDLRPRQSLASRWIQAPSFSLCAARFRPT